jgi:hypothetical protein
MIPFCPDALQAARRGASILMGVLAVSVSPSVSAVGQSVFATQVFASNTNGGAGGGIFNPANALGAPGGATAVHSLGIGGDLTLGFAVPIANGPGADFLVGENPFRLAGSWWQTFAETMFVEVSSDGLQFARFPARYFGLPVPPGPFGTVPVGAYGNLAGQHPVLAGAAGIDAQDVVDAGGDAFDLADLAGHPLVLGGGLDLGSITHVRLVDVQSGLSLDSAGVPIFDPGSGSADVDCVTVIHQQGLVAAGAPSVELTILADGTMTLRLSDPDGIADLDPASLRGALFGIPVDAAGLLAGFQVQSVDATGFTLVQPVPLPAGLQFTLSVSLKDQAGNRSGASRPRPN